MSHHRSLRSAGALCLSLLMVLGLCAGRSRLGPICVPGQRSLENFGMLLHIVLLGGLSYCELS